MTLLFPAHRSFWLHHISGCLLVVLAYLVMHAYYRQDVPTLTLSNVIGMVLFTLTALTFRALYKKYQWHALSTIKIVPCVFLFSIISGLVVAISLMLITKPLILDVRLANAPPDVHHRVIGSLLMYLTFTYQVIACGWAFIYSYIQASRQAHQTALANSQLQSLLKDAQLSSLSNQLNPHFLFNSLNNIRFAMYENQEMADNAITNLSELLRYSLDSASHSLVPLEQELDMVEKYVALQSIQFESRLSFTLNVQGLPDRVKVPPLSIQLLVENAIKHGIELMPEGGKVQVDIVSKQGQTDVTVANDKPLSLTSNTNSCQTGLDNIRQRLRLIYSGKARLETTDTSSRYTAILRLPVVH